MESNVKSIIATIPDYSQLRWIKCQPMFQKIINSICKTKHHASIFSCRLVINKLPYIIAAPTNDGFCVIIQNEEDKIQDLKRYLTDIYTDFSIEQPVHVREYEKCLRYTIEYRLESSWNKLGPYCIYGNDFLLKNVDQISAINMDIKVTGEQMLIALKQMALTFPLIKLENIVGTEMFNRFKLNPNGFIDFNTLNITTYIYVIPSLQRARVISVHNNITSDSPFATYEDLRSHWKKMYGYNLPESKDQIFYYKVIFPYFPKKTFIYPNTCVLNMPPQIYYNKSPIIDLNEAFYNDFKHSISHICGRKTEIIHLNTNENIENYMGSNIFTPNNELSALKPNMSNEDRRGGFDILRRNSNINLTPEFSGNTKKEIKTDSNISIPGKPSSKKTNYKSVIPSSPHISKYFQQKKFKLMSIKGIKEGEEMNRDKGPVKQNKLTTSLIIPSSFKPLYSSEELVRKSKD